MTISSSATRKAGPYNCNGATTNFAFSFKMFDAADLVVTLTDSSGVETTLTLTTHYTVSLNGDQNASPGGSITTVATYASGNTITITSDVDATQPTDLTSAGAWYPDTVEDALDRAVILIQQMEEVLRRTLIGPVSDASAIGALPSATARADMYLGFNSSGQPVAVSSIAPGTESTGQATLSGTSSVIVQGIPSTATRVDVWGIIASMSGTTDELAFQLGPSTGFPVSTSYKGAVWDAGGIAKYTAGAVVYLTRVAIGSYTVAPFSLSMFKVPSGNVWNIAGSLAGTGGSGLGSSFNFQTSLTAALWQLRFLTAGTDSITGSSVAAFRYR